MTDNCALQAHYPTAGARKADLAVHIVGLSLALIGSVVLVGLATEAHFSSSKVAGVAVYAASAVAMLSLSAGYNFATAHLRPLFHRLDRAGIFLMIAGSYTPFTTQVLTGAWAWGMTTAVWSIATLGAAGQVLLPRADHRFWVATYLGLGWLVVLVLKPLLEKTTWVALLLLLTGGLIYSAGVIFHLNKRLHFARAIWHGHVVAAAAAHWTAVLLGVVLVLPS